MELTDLIATLGSLAVLLGIQSVWITHGFARTDAGFARTEAAFTRTDAAIGRLEQRVGAFEQRMHEDLQAHTEAIADLRDRVSRLESSS